MTDDSIAGPAESVWHGVAALAGELLRAWGCWAPTLTPDGSRVAYVSDRLGTPQLWVQDTAGPGADAALIELSVDPVVNVSWSPDAQWLACSIATGGGVRTEVWVVRPDGTDARRVAGGDQHAVLGPWARRGHGLVVTLCSDEPHTPNQCLLIDPTSSGDPEDVAQGWLVNILDLTADGRFALVRDGTRGAQFCRLVDREADADHPVLPYPQTGSTDIGLLRPAPQGYDGFARVAYLVTDAGRPRHELLAIGFDEAGRRIAAGALGARPDAEVEFADADADGNTLVVSWNVDGRSEVELLDTRTVTRTPCPELPGDVVAGVAMARDGSCAVLAVEGPAQPRRLWRLDVADRTWRPVTPPSIAPDIAERLVHPRLVHYDAHDGLPLSGWLYPAHGNVAATTPGPAMLSLHGGPEAQERPIFTPQHQVLAAAGVTVFAPNIRGSSGYGHTFVHADDRWGRFDAIHDVARSAAVLAERGWADAARIAVTGRSYGGYATLMSLTEHAFEFAAGVDICGMSDMLTFFRDTEPWIAAAAVTKYGDPARDAALLAEISPLPRAQAIVVPLLVVHGELDTNVPRNEAVQIVARMRELGRDVRYLELAGEGHEYRRVDSRMSLLHGLTVFLAHTLLAAPVTAR
ncbi:S9 family peptidase [uncultured Jatrophihabitans sp.]|uniref:S9 family peptidase n=1 Tax=uncultured Jatrophihabitans sp. TaxID=1610747 RepID=UPI0035CA4C71